MHATSTHVHADAERAGDRFAHGTSSSRATSRAGRRRPDTASCRRRQAQRARFELVVHACDRFGARAEAGEVHGRRRRDRRDAEPGRIIATSRFAGRCADRVRGARRSRARRARRRPVARRAGRLRSVRSRATKSTYGFAVDRRQVDLFLVSPSPRGTSAAYAASKCSVPVGTEDRERHVRRGTCDPAAHGPTRSRRRRSGATTCAASSTPPSPNVIATTSAALEVRCTNRTRSMMWIPRSISAPPPDSFRSKNHVASGAQSCGPACPNAARTPTISPSVPDCDRVARGDDGRDVAEVVRDVQHDAGSSRRRDHLVGLVDGARDRLLDEDVLAGLRRGDRLLGVERVRRADVDGVDVVASDHRRQSSNDLAAASALAGCGFGRCQRPRTRTRRRRRPSRALKRRDVRTPSDRAAADRCARRERHVSRVCVRPLLTAVATSSQSDGLYAAPDADRQSRARRALRSAGTCPSRRRRRSGARRSATARPCSSRCAWRGSTASRTRACRRTSARTGRLRHAAPSRTRCATSGDGRNHVMDEPPSPSGSCDVRSSQSVDVSEPSEDLALVRPEALDDRRQLLAAVRPRSRRRSPSCAGSRRRTVR